MVANHLTSKGSGSGLDADQGDGQGASNATRAAAAEALVDWIATEPTGSGDPDVLITGDRNSYLQEDPIRVMEAGADGADGTSDDYVNLVEERLGAVEACSYVFSGQQGNLDHALATRSLAGQVTGVAEPHINADEPDLLGYSSEFTNAAYFNQDPYASSDHDPLLVGLDLAADGGEGVLFALSNQRDEAKRLDRRTPRRWSARATPRWRGSSPTATASSC